VAVEDASDLPVQFGKRKMPMPKLALRSAVATRHLVSTVKLVTDMGELSDKSWTCTHTHYAVSINIVISVGLALLLSGHFCTPGPVRLSFGRRWTTRDPFSYTHMTSLLL